MVSGRSRRDEATIFLPSKYSARGIPLNIFCGCLLIKLSIGKKVYNFWESCTPELWTKVDGWKAILSFWGYVKNFWGALWSKTVAYLGGGFKLCLIFGPKIGVSWSNLTCIYFRWVETSNQPSYVGMVINHVWSNLTCACFFLYGWLNHQLVMICWGGPKSQNAWRKVAGFCTNHPKESIYVFDVLFICTFMLSNLIYM